MSTESPDENLADFEKWGDETGYPLYGEPGSLVGQPVGLDPEDPLEWVEKWDRLGGIPLKELFTPTELQLIIDSFRPPADPGTGTPIEN